MEKTSAITKEMDADGESGGELDQSKELRKV